MSLDSIIFNGKTLSDMFSDVYRNTDSKRDQINQFISSMVKLIRTPEDAVVIGPIIRDFLDINIKNDEHVVRLVQIAQRLVSVNKQQESGGDLLSDEEKQQLLKSIKDDFNSVIVEQEELEDTIQTLKR